MDSRARGILGKEPEFIRDTPLDLFFVKLHNDLLAPIDGKDMVEAYLAAGFASNELFTQELLDRLVELHGLVLSRTPIKNDEDDVLPISLHDMKYLDKLLNLIIVYGIHVNIPKRLRILLDTKMVLGRISEDRNLLRKVVETLLSIMVPEYPDDYLYSVLLKGPVYTHLFLGLQVCIHDTRDDVLVAKVAELEARQDTYRLFVMYTFLVQSFENENPIKQVCLDLLSTLPLRRENDGVISLVDFVVGVREDEQISTEKLSRVNQILLSKPKKISSSRYLSLLFPQIYDGLTYVNRPILISCLNNLVTAFYLRNKKIIHDFLLSKIYEVLFNDSMRAFSVKQVNDMINVLISLSKNSSEELIQFVTSAFNMHRFYLNLWIYALFLKKNQKLSPIAGEDLQYYQVILSLLKSFIQLTNNYNVLKHLSLNLVNFEHDGWKYTIDLETQLARITLASDDGMEIRQKESSNEELNQMSLFFKDMDVCIQVFIELLHMINDNDTVRTIFLDTLSRWVKAETETSIHEDMLVLLDLKLLQALNKEFQEDIIEKGGDVLRVIDEVIDFNAGESLEEVDSDDEDSDVEGKNYSFGTIIKGLLLAILDSSTGLEDVSTVLLSIKSKVKDVELIQRIDKLLKDNKEKHNASKQQRSKDRDLLHKAMVDLGDQLLPIQVSGLLQLQELVKTQSEAISCRKVAQIHLDYLTREDPYLYLNAIKGLSKLCEIDPETVLHLVTDCYRGAKKLDTQLRAGEVLVNYIKRENELFTGRRADAIVDVCLEKIGHHDTVDNRLRMSAMSILGVCLQVNAKGIISRIGELLDCAFNILQLETSTAQKKKKNSFLLRRAAIHMLHDLLYHAGLELFPEPYTPAKMRTLLEYVLVQESEDPLVREQATQLLALIMP